MGVRTPETEATLARWQNDKAAAKQAIVDAQAALAEQSAMAKALKLGALPPGGRQGVALP